MLTKFSYEYKGKKIIKYKTFATKSVINKLKTHIHPDYWFIFPEELPEEDPNYKIIFKD